MKVKITLGGQELERDIKPGKYRGGLIQFAKEHDLLEHFDREVGGPTNSRTLHEYMYEYADRDIVSGIMDDTFGGTGLRYSVLEGGAAPRDVMKRMIRIGTDPKIKITCKK